MKALITGGSGRVGTELVPLIVSQGWDVRVLQRGASQPLPAAMSGVEVVAGSVTDRAIVDAAIADVDVVCHLAALMPPVSNDQLFEANLRGSFNLLEAIRMSAKRPALVYASTDATYGTGLSDRPYPEPIVEDTAPRPTNFYGVTKLAAERMLSHYCRIYALSFLTLRYCWVFRAAEVLELFALETWDEFLSDSQRRELAQLPNPVPALFDNDGKPFSDHVIDARDAARATALALAQTHWPCEAVNICGPAPFRYVDHSPHVARALGRPLVELKLENFHAYSLDTTRAQELLGFKADYDLTAMIREVVPNYTPEA
jgi:UDP-glucose 4-epimerase